MKLKWMRFYMSRRFRIKHFLLVLTMVLAIIGIFLVFSAFSKIVKAQRLTKMHLSNVNGRIFRTGKEHEDEAVHMERMWKEPEWRVARILRQIPNIRNPIIPVVVVEEHYEVLKYWFDAAQTGVLPKSGNTLLHIDGHSDGAPPRDLSIVPWFRLPLNHSEVANMMQSNDVFIAATGLTGLINRYIWVWPEWARAEKDGETDHEVIDIYAGWRTYYPKAGKPFQRVCVCLRSHNNGAKPSDWECVNDEPRASEMGGGAMIQSMNCTVVMTGTFEQVNEQRALELLKRGGWIKKDEHLMLDIDEDYFGCESSVMPLYKEKFTMSSINKITEVIQKFLCVNDVHSEFLADKIFRTLVQIVHDFKASVCEDPSSKSTKDCLSDFDADKAIIQMIPLIVHSLKEANIERLLCDNDWNEVMLQAILRMLFSFSTRQLVALKYVGVCLEQAPTSLMFEPESLHVCHGFNVPGDSEVIFHVPTVEENKKRSELLENTLSLLPQQPKLITVCRSMRDGYTPWEFFTYIERSIMKILKSVFMGVEEESYHFDENLLGGKNGWPERM